MSTLGSPRPFLNRRQTSDLPCDFATGGDQIGDEPVVNVEDALDVAPDGRFLINTMLDEAAAPITLIQDWQPDAKE